MQTYISLVFIVLSANGIFFSSVNSLECRYCSSTDYSSDCRTGNETNLRTCTIDGEDHCYVEYILNDGRKPLYRRGCAPGDWCQQQVRNHGTALKFCNTCQGSKCNDDTIGSKDPSTILCRSCESENFNDECRQGTVKTTESCQKGSRCLQYRVSTSRRDIWKRECGDMNSCAELEDTYGHSLEECKTCKHELCNNNPMRFG